MKLSRSRSDLAKAPVRIVHIGLGAFHRAHQAWYTDKVDLQKQWGIAAFTGRSPEASVKLNSQDNLYTIIERGAEGDSVEVISAISESHDIHDYAKLIELIADPDTAIVSLTITEAGYRLNLQGGLDRGDSAINKDLENLERTDYQPETTVFKIAAGLVSRFKQHAKPIAILSCDNLSGNGVRLQSGMSEIFSSLPAEIDSWFRQNVTFPSTSVDRITPKVTSADIDELEKNFGIVDASPVVTEPFSSWIIQGAFPAGRPAWEKAGAIFVDEIEQFENRKLWLLNGSHSLMAYTGLNREISTVAQAMRDPEVRQLVEDFWDEAAEFLQYPELDIANYRQALIERYENHRIEHKLAQIAIDGATKLVVRCVPIALLTIESGRIPKTSAELIAQWIVFIKNNPQFQDSRRSEIDAALESHDPTKSLISLLSHDLAENKNFYDLVSEKISDRLINH